MIFFGFSLPFTLRDLTLFLLRPKIGTSLIRHTRFMVAFLFTCL